MTSFCSAVVVELLGSVSVVDTNIVKRILPYVVSGLQSEAKGDPEHTVSYNPGCMHVCYDFFIIPYLEKELVTRTSLELSLTSSVVI